MIYDLLFFFMVIIIVLNLIFGVIIDTFADLRSEKQKKEEILKTTCFICGECGRLAFAGELRPHGPDGLHAGFLWQGAIAPSSLSAPGVGGTSPLPPFCWGLFAAVGPGQQFSAPACPQE